MAEKSIAYGSDIPDHYQVCTLHKDERSKLCSGNLKKGGICINKAIDPPEPDIMPTCRIHQDQRKRLGWCQALLPCDFECKRICQWKPHAFQLCFNHLQHPMSCYFLKIPIEMRLRIYRFLLTDELIPARRPPRQPFISYTGNHRRMYMAIFRVNRQIHDEAASLLYGITPFTIELSGDGLTMCNSTEIRTFSGLDNSTLQDYQMQLMLLQHQNAMRRNMSLVQNIPHFPGSPPRNISQVSYTYGPSEPVWTPSLSERYFNMIQFFHIEIEYPISTPQGMGVMDRRAPDLVPYDYCDDLYRLIGRLRLPQRSISRLQITIKLGNAYQKHDEAFCTSQLLLRPFLRLKDVVKPEVLSITIQDAQSRESVELMAPIWNFSAVNNNFATAFQAWLDEFFSSEPSAECSKMFRAYWQLEKLVNNVEEHYSHGNTRFQDFRDLLHSARVAREDNDILSFKKTWDIVVGIWQDFLTAEKEFESEVACSIDSVYGLITNRSWEE